MKELAISLGLVLASAIIGLTLVELFASVILPEPAKRCFVFPPGFEATMHPDPDIIRGVSGSSRFIVNQQGFRGSDQPERYDLGVLVIGGSTSECLYLDQDEAWPAMLGQKLAQQTAMKIWIANAGKSGLNSNHNLYQLQQLERQGDLQPFNWILYLVGVNDLGYFLAHPGRYFKEGTDQVRTKSFSVLPEHDRTLIKRSGTWRLARALKVRISGDPYTQNADGSIYQQWRANRQHSGSYINDLPELTPALSLYRSNLESIVALARRNQMGIAFVTQPVLWQDNPDPSLSGLLWMGGIGEFMQPGSHQYYSAGALKSGMNAFNGVLSDVGKQAGILVIDLASQLPANPTIFYDDCHFTEYGAQRVAELLTEGLIPYME